MFFVVDIDGVLAANGNEIARYLNTELTLGIAEEDLIAMRSSAEIVKHPQVLAYASRGPEYVER